MPPAGGSVDVAELCRDLAVERASLFDVLARCDVDLPTPAPGWTIRDQLTHLAWFDQAATQSLGDPGGFRAHRADLVGDVEGVVERARAMHEQCPRDHVLSWLDASGRELAAVASAADPSVRTPWYGPDMTVASLVTARIMETWAHGQDVRDALGAAPGTANLHHVAFIGWRAVANSFRARGLPIPDAPIRVELGELVLGPPEAADVVSGSLLDFCLVVTQRRHVADTGLVAVGDVARTWLPIAQAFAGPPGIGRQPGQFR